MKRKTVIILIGPKGSGKTHVGTVTASHTDIEFIRVESLWLKLGAGEDGWARVEAEADHVLQTVDTVMIESLGGTDGFERLRANLAGKYSLRLLRIRTDLDICLQRIKNRGVSDHIPVSDDQVEKYNILAERVELDWDAELENSNPASCEEILRVVGSLY